MTPETISGLVALGPWGILAWVVIYIARKVEAGRWITIEHHMEVVRYLEQELETSRIREKQLLEEAATAATALAKLTSLLSPERRFDDPRAEHATAEET